MKQTIESITVEAEALLARLQALNVPAGSTIAGTLEAILAAASASTPVGATVAALTGLFQVGQGLFDQFQALAGKVKQTSPAVWDGLVASGVIADAAVQASATAEQKGA